MEIIKIVVDELPSDCWECDKSYWIGEVKEKGIRDAYYCTEMERLLENEVDTSRPDWCPLISVYADPKTAMKPVLDWIEKEE